MINNKEFWNDELVKEFFYEHYQECINALRATNTGKSIEDFKKSKQSPNKDYEIVSYLNPNIVTDIEGGNIEKANTYASLRNYPIHSVKRKDGEIFTLGDNTDEGVIKAFYVEYGMLHVTTENKGGALLLHEIEKIKERIPLFTTVDGVEIFEGDNFWMLFTAPNGIGDAHVTRARQELLPLQSYQKTFSTEDKARIYIEENRPTYSKSDMREAFNHAVIRGGIFETNMQWLKK